jgi:hypothetical protein
MCRTAPHWYATYVRTNFRAPVLYALNRSKTPRYYINLFINFRNKEHSFSNGPKPPIGLRYRTACDTEPTTESVQNGFNNRVSKMVCHKAGIHKKAMVFLSTCHYSCISHYRYPKQRINKQRFLACLYFGAPVSLSDYHN